METKRYTQSEDLNRFIDELREAGFTIILSEKSEDWSHFHFAKDNKIGYVELDTFKLPSFSTVHKPCKECGTGFGMFNRNDVVLLTVENAQKTLDTFAPNWATAWDRKAVRKYASVDEFLLANKQWGGYYVLA